ncbi:hypothetical protein OsI_18187 [Oryza sativa Indica Group]|uniref:ACT domain-containing protein n=1 Tax=Oryza sativa subsp. indica TaxID=39946 RepID=B8AXA1_ORYSI|nr:hypothetical protein OsI_18187 [Oryza sativa Indica Group]
MPPVGEVAAAEARSGMVLGGGAAAAAVGGGEDAVVMQVAGAEGPGQHVSTDGQWCFVVFWVVPRTPSIKVRWANLKNRLMSMCPSNYPMTFYPEITQPGPSQFYLLKLFSADRKGLLHGENLSISFYLPNFNV